MQFSPRASLFQRAHSMWLSSRRVCSFAVQVVKGLPFTKGHSSAGMAGAFARVCNAQHLVLTHFSQRYVGAAATPAAAVAATAPHVEQASIAAGHQRVYAAQDLQVFHVAAHIAPASTRTN